jgi:hypothetical protein
MLPGGRDVTWTDDGLRLVSWYVRVDTGRATVLVSPGHAGNRSLTAPLARALSVLLLDYRGYGGDSGDPTESELALDVRAGNCDKPDPAGLLFRPPGRDYGNAGPGTRTSPRSARTRRGSGRR